MMQSIKNKLGPLRVIIVILNRLTGRSARHNRALRDIRDWTATVKQFLNDYELYGSQDTGILLKNISQANFDLIAMSHKGGRLVPAAASISHAHVFPLLVKVIDEVENTRRTLMNPASRDIRLPEVVTGLCVSFEKLQEKLSEIEYL
jgi:hypothetical protein